MGCDPKQKVAKLTETTTNAFSDHPVAQHQSLQITLSPRRAPHKFPNRERFARSDHDLINASNRQL